MPDHAWALVLLGLVAGVMSGMFGIGGGIIIVPVLSLLFGYELQRAIGTSLGVLVMPVSFFAVLAYYRAKQLQIGPAALIAGGLLIGGVFGAQMALNLPTATLQRAYGLFLITIGWRFIEPRQLWAARRGQIIPAKVEKTAEPQVAWYALLIVGLIAGVASGLFGIGGGLVIVPALVALLNYDQKRAVGTSLAALLPPVGLGAVISYYDANKIELAAVAFIALGLVGGAFAGARIALGLPSSTVKRLYGVFLLIVSLRFLLQI
jgi:hypothetical protein